MTKPSQLRQIEILPGVMPSTDATAFDIPCYAFSQGVRFDPNTGRPRKIGGWLSQTFNYDAEILGTTRTIYSATINSKVYTVVGTNSYLYSLIGSSLTNITPLETTPVAAANSLATHYDTLAANPIATTNGSKDIVISDADAADYQLNDTYTLSGSSSVNGILAAAINTDHVVRAIGAGTITVRVATAATSTGSGGGAAVVRTSGLITLTDAAHGLLDGYRVKIDGAASMGGILDTEINQEFIVRNVTPNTFDFMTAGTATSAVTADGGAGTEYYPQIGPGAVNQGQGQGYGAGLYGVGLYGTALVSNTGATYPRIWFVDRFGENLVMTAGNSSEAYVWDGQNNTAPEVITNAPTDVNYLFVSDNILVTFGHDVENQIFASDQGDITNWTSSSTNQVFQDNVEGAGRLISHVPVDGYNLIFTEQQTYTFKYIGLPNIWQIQLLDPNIGIIAPMARCSVNGIAYWMGQQNFYMFRGGKVEIIPCNFGLQSSIWRYVFDNLNYSQRFKIFAWYNEEWDEIWWHYPSSGSNECDRIARFSRKLLAWVPDVMDRTAGEYPDTSLSNPRLANVGAFYVHESGNNADDSALPFTYSTKKFLAGKDSGFISTIIPDNRMTGTIEANLSTYLYPSSSSAMQSLDYNVTQTTEKVVVGQNARIWQYAVSGDELDQEYLMGQWMEELQASSTAP